MFEILKESYCLRFFIINQKTFSKTERYYRFIFDDTEQTLFFKNKQKIDGFYV